MKICSRCKIEKELTNFYKTKRNKDGFNYQCKSCCSEYDKSESGKETNKKKSKKYRISDNGRTTVLKLKRKFNSSDKGKILSKKSKLKSYGLTIEQFEIMLKNQNGVCYICKEPNKNNHDLCVDHNHTTNKVRGLLCSNCNRGIGLLQDSFEILQAAADYLKNNN